jgi:hypothetical protein
MAWNPAEPRDELWVINLETGEKWSPGPGRAPSFVNPRTVRVFVRATPQERESQVNIDVYTGERVPEPSSTTPGAAAAPRTWDVREAWQAVDGRHFLVTDAQGKPVLKFDGLEFRLVGNDELLVARMLQAEEVSFYLVHLPSGAPAFLGRFRFDPASSGPQVFLMTATDRYILWHAYCSDINPGLYDRRTGVLTEISVGEMGRGLYARLTSNNLVGLGSFGPDALVDPVTLEYVFAVPTYDASTGYGYGDVRWSPNYRYASQGTFGGHGGLCG